MERGMASLGFPLHRPQAVVSSWGGLGLALTLNTTSPKQGGFSSSLTQVLATGFCQLAVNGAGLSLCGTRPGAVETEMGIPGWLVATIPWPFPWGLG